MTAIDASAEKSFEKTSVRAAPAVAAADLERKMLRVVIDADAAVPPGVREAVAVGHLD